MRNERDIDEIKLRGKKQLLLILAVCVVMASIVLAAAFGQRARSPAPEPPPDTPETQGVSAESAPGEDPAYLPVYAPRTEIPPVELDDPAGLKLVALTFDDGPHPEHTPRLLDILREEGVRATFFVIGLNIEKAPEPLARAAAEGHQIGNHTYHHKDLTKLGPERRAEEIESCAALIEDVTGRRPNLLRPPYGVQSAALQAGADTPLIYWSIDPEDWRTRDADKTYRHVMERVRDGDIILMHDWYGESVDAAERLIPALKAQGFTLVTVDQLLAARGGAGPGDAVRKRPAE